MTGTLIWEKSANYTVKLTDITLEKQRALKNCRCRGISNRASPEWQGYLSIQGKQGEKENTSFPGNFSPSSPLLSVIPRREKRVTSNALAFTFSAFLTWMY